ncbi:MAG: LPD7 domain-containing protein [Steroidobacter sp.]
MSEPRDPTDSPKRRSNPRASAIGDASAATSADAVNAISFGETTTPGGAAGAARAVTAQAEERPARKRKSRGKAKGSDPPGQLSMLDERRAPIPDSVQERFIRIGNQFYFSDGAEAFTDHGNRLTTRSENTVVIQSMIAIAQARGSTDVTVSGSEFFRSEAWFAAKLAGLDARGYEPTQLEQERIVRAIARRDPARPVAPITDATVVAPSENAAPRAQQIPAPHARAVLESDFVIGRLVDHGPAPFQHNPKQPMSYYVRIETERGDIERWGVDLERAVRQSLSRPGVGDEVGLRVVGSDPVTVRAAKHDSQGREIAHEEVRTHRNQWVLERKDFLDERARMAELFRNPEVSAADATNKYPELEGSYVQLQLGRVMGEQQYATAAHREQFVEHLRGYLAKEIEQGRPLQPVPLRERRDGPIEPERVHDRDYVPGR